MCVCYINVLIFVYAHAIDFIGRILVIFADPVDTGKSFSNNDLC